MNRNIQNRRTNMHVSCTWACRCPNWPKITTPSRFATYISKKFVLCTKSHIFGFTLRYSFIISHCLGGIQAFSCNGFTVSPNIWAAPYVRLRRLGPKRPGKFIMFIGASIINIISICKFNLMKLKVIFTNLISYYVKKITWLIKLFIRYMIHNPIITLRISYRIGKDTTRAVDIVLFVNTGIIRNCKRRFVSTNLESWKYVWIEACIPLNKFTFRICGTYKISLFPC